MTPSDIGYIERHILEAGRTELRAIDPAGRVMSGLFDQPAPLTSAIWHLRQQANLYITIQAPKPLPAANEMRSGSRALRNDDIGHYIRLPFDFDAIRPKGQAATDLQLDYTWEAAQDVRRFLHRQGWPLPAADQSGNGHHLVYRTAPIPNTPKIREQLKVIYAGLALDFGNAAVSFDTMVRNPGRILRVPGSINLKVPDDPRQVRVEIPTRWRQVTPRQIEQLANVYRVLSGEVEPTPQADQPPHHRQRIDGSGDYSTLDVVGWFAAHSHYIGHLEDRKHGVRCPWSDQHTSASPTIGSDSIIFEADESWPGFFCHHDHCQGRNIRDVLHIWGDADQFCARAFQPGEPGQAGRAE